jgi:hypothetical protein
MRDADGITGSPISVHGFERTVAYGAAAPRRSIGRTLWCVLLTMLLAHGAAVRSVRAEFQVNTYTLGDQQYPSIAGNPAGETVMVWSSSPGQGIPSLIGNQLGLFGQRYDSTGARVGSEFQINAISGGHVWNGATVAMSASGNFAVAWAGEPSGSGTGPILARLYDSTGTALTGELQVNTYTPGLLPSPRVAMDSAGNFVIVWTSWGQDGSEGGVFGQRFDSSGAPVGTEFQVNTYTLGDQGSNGLAIASAPDGRLMVVWENTKTPGVLLLGADTSLCGQRFDSAGAAVGTEFQVNTSGGTNGLEGASVAADADGGFIVVWARTSFDSHNAYQFDIRGQRYGSDGTALGAEFVVSPASSNAHHSGGPTVAVDGAGNFVVLWNTLGEDGGPYTLGHLDIGSESVAGRRFDVSGTPLGPKFQVNTFTLGNQYGPAVAVGASGNLFAVWTSSFCPLFDFNCLSGQDGSFNAVEAQRFVLTTPSCSTLPQLGCRQAQHSQLTLQNSNGRKTLLWNWLKGERTLAPGDLGNPAAGLDGYALCTYLDTGAGPALATSAAIPAQGTCAGKPCWKARIRNGGFTYYDPDGLVGGMRQVRLTAGQAGRAALSVRGQGTNLSLPALPIVGYAAATVQLINAAGECWEAGYSAPTVNNGRFFHTGF